MDQRNELGLQKEVLFLGKRDDIPALLHLSDIFVLPSLIENQSVSLIESQIAGKAAIVSDSGGLPEMVDHKVTGLLTPVGDITALADNLEKLLRDDTYRTKLGANAKKWGIEHWSMDSMIKQMIKQYEVAIEKRKER